MSKIMEKTLASLPKLLVQGFSGGTGPKVPSTREPNPDVLNFMRAVHRARSKSHEMSIVLAELSVMEKKMKQADLTSSPALVRAVFSKAIFCHLLGYDVMFLAIYAIKLAHQGKGYFKKLGYLMASILLHPNHAIAILITGTLLKDVMSSNMGDNFAALSMAGSLLSDDAISAMLPDIRDKLRHSHDLVKEKVLYCLRALYLRSPTQIEPSLTQLGSFLSSRDPGVLSAVVSMFLLLCEKDPKTYTGLGRSFLHILHQINNRGFGSSYYRHMVPLPWLQINLLKVMGHLGSMDADLSRSLAPTLQTLIEKTKVTEPISLALLVESILTATKIKAGDELLQLCSRCIAKLLSPDARSDMRFHGLGLLIAVSRVNPTYTAEHQTAVLESLCDPDLAIQHRTTELLHSMANTANVKAICNKLFEQVDKLTDDLFISDVFRMISDLAGKFSIDTNWYIQTYFRILQHRIPSNSSKSVESVLSHIISPNDKGTRCQQIISGSSFETLFQTLENEDSTFSALSLAISLFGVLAPFINTFPSSSRFLAAVERFIFLPSNSKDKNMSQVIIPSLSSLSSGLALETGTNTAHFSACVETLIKLVLSGSLSPQLVAAWLEENKERQIKTNLTYCCDMQELEHLVHNPQNLQLCSAIMFGNMEDFIDLSLSFLDSLIVQHYMQTNDILKPEYLLAEKSNKYYSESEFKNTPSLPHLFQSQASIDSEFGKSMEKSKPVKKTFGKWTEDDGEGTDSLGQSMSEMCVSSASDLESSRHQQMAQELFAGLSMDTSQDTQSLMMSSLEATSQPRAKSAKSLWDSDDDDDDDDDDTEVSENRYTGISKLVGLNLNPFGISKKSKAAKSSGRWSEENMELKYRGEDGADEIDFLSAQVEKIETTMSSMTQSDHQFLLFSSMTSPTYPDSTSHHLSQSLDEVQTQDSGMGSREVSGGGLSIYSDIMTDGTAEKASTVDAITDSEPED